MKKLLALFLLLATPAFGQGTGSLQNHAIPLGKGTSVRGFTPLPPSSVTNAPLLNTPNADPAWGLVPALNLAAGTGISINVVGTTATIASTATGGVTSLGGATGVLTLGTGFTIPGNALTYTQNTIQGGTGAVTRTVQSKLNDVFNVMDYGAVCDGSTDDTTAFTNAIAAAANGKLILPPNVNCKVKGSGSFIFTIASPMILDCQGSSITLDATVPNTRTLFLFRPLGTGDRLPKRRVTQCLLDMNGVGAATITIDTTATNTTEIGEFEIDHVRDTASGTTTVTNASILVNNIGTNTNGGTFNVNFHDNVLFNGIYVNLAGDSLRINNNILSGSKFGIYANLIGGAAGLIINGNNVTAADPLLIDAAGGNTVITNNEFEQLVTNTDPLNAVVDIRGTGTITHVTYVGNSINALASTGSPIPLKINSASQVYAESNTFTTAASVVCIVNAGAGTIIGASNSFSGCSSNVSNTGTLKYVQVGLTP